MVATQADRAARLWQGLVLAGRFGSEFIGAPMSRRRAARSPVLSPWASRSRRTFAATRAAVCHLGSIFAIPLPARQGAPGRSRDLGGMQFRAVPSGCRYRALPWLAVPCICEFDGITVYIYHRDHNPPHFHVICAGDRAVFSIAAPRLTGGKLPASRQRQVRAWAMAHRAELQQCWDLAAANEPPGKIS